MKKVFFIACFLTSIFAQAQGYTFISDSLRLLPMQELMKKEPPADFKPVYYEDGTQVAFKKVLPLIIERKLILRCIISLKRPNPESFRDLVGHWYKASKNPR